MCMFAIVSMAQLRTLSTRVMSGSVGTKDYLTYTVTGGAADTLSVLQDTIRIPFLLNKDFPAHYYAKIKMKPIAGADTTVVVNVKGKMFDTDTWTLIETATTAAITTEVNTVLESMTDASWRLDSLNLKPFYRQLMFELIIKGNDATGIGIEFEKLELAVNRLK